MDLRVLPSREWAQRVAEELVDRLQPQSAIRLCLAAGSTPIPVYELLPASALSDSTVFLLDEYGGLPVGHAARCQTQLTSSLVDRVQPKELHIPNVDAVDLEAECRFFDRLIADGGIDLAVLGLGTNGHLGMNEPGSAAGSPTRVVNLADETRAGARRYGADPPPTWGITVGMEPLLASSEIWLVTTGSRKAEILERTLRAPVGPDLPSSFLQMHANAIVWADEEAAGLL